MALIIIEGCDGTGKTTLIQSLAAELNLPIVKSYKPRSLVDIDQFDNWANACPRPPICDRHAAISDLVYGPIIRGSTPSTLEHAQAKINNNFLVYCAPPFTAVQNNIHVEPQMNGVKDQLRKIYTAYENLMYDLEPHFQYDYTVPGAHKALVTQLMHFLERNR